MALRAHYKPDKPYFGQIQLILVHDPKLEENVSKRQGHVVESWKHWAPNLVCLHAPGNHMTVLKAPHVFTLAQLIQAARTGTVEGASRRENIA
jgi:thioesterase domain-containing protein